jgi:RNA polymerase sigma-70 factor (ECF subfamily)
MIAAARDGDPQTVARVLELFRPYLLAVARRRLNAEIQSKLGGSDLVQETLNEARQGFPRFVGSRESGLKVWLRAVLLNNLADARAKFLTRKRRVSRERPWEGRESKEFIANHPTSHEDLPSEILRKRESAELVQIAISRLKERHQAIIRLRHLDELPFSQIAQRLGMTEKATRMLHMRALERLANLYDRKPDRDARE